MPAPQTRADGGFTLIEVLMTTVVMGVILGFAIGGWRGYAAAREQSGAGQQVREALRQAQQQAVTEGTYVCVTFASTSYQVYDGSCDSSSKVALGSPRTLPDGISFQSPSFTTGPGATVPGVTFRSRGTATPGSVSLRRDGSTTTTSISVEGLTGRVALD